MKEAKNWLIFGGIAVSILLYLIWKKNNTVSAPSTPSAPTPGTSLPSPPVVNLTSVGAYTVLSKGDKAIEVKYIQDYYNSKVVPFAQNKSKIANDGKFGDQTLAAVQFVTGQTTTTWNQFKNTVDLLPTSFFN